MKKILVLGAGMVSQPLVAWLLNKGYQITLADMNKLKAIEILKDHPNGIAESLDANNEEELERMIADSDIVVSLLPYSMHLIVANFCIMHRKSMVTTSYQSPGMVELKSQIEESDIVILNEMGLDPGIDLMSAKKLIDRVHSLQGKIYNFYSLCGALPAPESVDNPLGYKFTWSPKGVMNASLNSAQYLSNGEEVIIPAEKIFYDPFKIDFPEIGLMDVYPNRDSTVYISEFGIEEAKTVLRGTIRLPGWCETLDAMKKLGLLDTNSISMQNMTYFNLIERKVGTLYPQYECQIAKFLNIEESSVAIQALKWLGYFSNETINRSTDSPFNVTSDMMFSKMMLKDGDRDMIVMQHELLVRYPGDREERIISRLLEFGTPAGDTAIAKTVALPAAIAVDMILSGELKLKGLLRPLVPEIYEPVLQRLEEMGIIMKEEVKQLV